MNAQNQVLKRNISNLESDIESNNKNIESERLEAKKMQDQIQKLKLELGKITPTPKSPNWDGFGNAQAQKTTFVNADPFGSANAFGAADPFGQPMSTADPFGAGGGAFGAFDSPSNPNAFGAPNVWGRKCILSIFI